MTTTTTPLSTSNKSVSISVSAPVLPTIHFPPVRKKAVDSSSSSAFTSPRQIKRGRAISSSSPLISKKIGEHSSSRKPIERSVSVLNAPNKPKKRIQKKSITKESKGSVSVTIPIEVFIENVVSVGEITFSVWRKRIFEELTLQARTQLKNKEPLTEEMIKQIVASVLASSLQFSSVIERIEKAASFLSKVDEYAFLKQFERCYDPQLFWDKYHTLESEQKKILDPIAGLSANNQFETYKIICHSAGTPRESLKQECQAHIQALINSKPHEEKLQKFTVKFNKKFDSCCPDLIKPPLCFIQPRDIKETFRSFLAKDKTLTTLLVFNGEKIAKPDHNGIDEDQLFEYLLNAIDSRIAKSGAPTAKQQYTILMGTLPYKIEDLSTPCLKFLEADSNYASLKYVTYDCLLKFAEHFTKQKDASPLADIMNHYSLFCRQALKQAVQDFPDWKVDQVIDFFKAISPRLFILREAEKNVPSFRLLQALSFSAYTTSEFFIRKSFCPELSSSHGGSYHMKHTPINPTKYNVRFIAEENAFAVTHIKPYAILHSGNQKKLAEVTIHWTLTGKLQETDFSAQFRVAHINFKEKVLLEERLEILNHFKMQWESTPWDDYLSTGSSL